MVLMSRAVSRMGQPFPHSTGVCAAKPEHDVTDRIKSRSVAWSLVWALQKGVQAVVIPAQAGPLPKRVQQKGVRLTKHRNH